MVDKKLKKKVENALIYQAAKAFPKKPRTELRKDLKARFAPILEAGHPVFSGLVDKVKEKGITLSSAEKKRLKKLGRQFSAQPGK